MALDRLCVLGTKTTEKFSSEKKVKMFVAFQILNMVKNVLKLQNTRFLPFQILNMVKNVLKLQNTRFLPFQILHMVKNVLKLQNTCFFYKKKT